MSTRYKDYSSESITQAVETLTYLADLDVEQGAFLNGPDAQIFQKPNSILSTVTRLSEDDVENTVVVVKETFRVILNYLRHCYQNDFDKVESQHTLEGIKTIMVLVGEAAKKIDKYRRLFHQATFSSVTELKEYKKLQEFYQSRIAKRVDEGVLGKWVLALTKKALIQNRELTLIAEKNPQSHHVFVDLESVKRDAEYELFFMRKENGTRFFSPRLMRSMKLVCDFGGLVTEKESADPLLDYEGWSDLYYQATAANILRSIGQQGDRFYKEAYKYKDNECVLAISKTLMALMLCRNYHRSADEDYGKTCAEYFEDFQVFLREALQTYEYHKWITYAGNGNSVVARCCVKILHVLSKGLYTHASGFDVLKSKLAELLYFTQGANQNENVRISHWLEESYAAMQKESKRFGNGSLKKIVDVLQNGRQQTFDPLRQGAVPCHLYKIKVNDQQMINLFMPSPTVQEYIHKACIIEEFKAFLRQCSDKDGEIKRFLLINLQDRTSWREHARCEALEDLQFKEGLGEPLTVVTLPKDTEFYHQMATYKEDNIAENFIAHFKRHVGDATSGFYLPSIIKNKLPFSSIEGIIDAIHGVFFSNKNILIREHRLDFIEIFDLFLTLKIFEIVKPDAFSFVCKDGIDVGQSMNILLYLFLCLLNDGKIGKEDQAYVSQMLHLPAFLSRNRAMLPERFNRMISALKRIEAVQLEKGKSFRSVIKEVFGSFYHSTILESQV